MRLAYLIIVIPLVAASCGAPRMNNTRLDSADLVAMTDQMAASLLAADVVASRTAGSPRWIISMDRVTNRTSDVIPRRELWAFMGRLRALLNQSPALRQRNIVFVLSPDQAQAIGERHAEAAGTRAQPTHALSATFESLTQDTRSIRSDTYLCAYQLIDLHNDVVIWEDHYEVKRTVMRDEWD